MAIRLSPGPIVVASHNSGKAREIVDLLGPFGIAVKSAAELGLPEPEETGTTFEANAILKAKAAAEASGLVALADDSGLAVNSLDGAPGIFSARWAGPTKDFSLAMRKVEDALQERGATSPQRRRAQFVAALALATPEGEVETFTGRVEGTLVWPPRGDKGFGYDPVFMPDGHSRTFGEMSAEEKHGWRPGQTQALSHRARAFQLLARRHLGVMMRALIDVPESATAFGIYVHWPFCAAKCPYCDFNSHVRHQPPDEKRFSAALSRELTHFAALTPGRTVTSIFLGGGTPSLMKPQTVSAVLETIAKLWSVASDAEITLEANPGSVEAERFRGYRAAGVNRLSLGVQSLDESALKALGKIHSVAEARRALELARQTFPRLSFDLIYARPAQTLDAWRTELEAALGMAADHLSLYQLTIDPETPFFRLHETGKLAIPDPELAAEFYALTQEITEAHGLPAYEISNHAAPGGESRHNLTYWRYQDYVGAGPGAHGRITVDGVKRATMSEKHPEQWLAKVEESGHALITDEALTLEEAADEMLLMGLRLREGVPSERYRQMSGRGFSTARLDFLREHGLIEVAGDGRLRTTLDGWLVLDSVVADLAA